MRSSQRSTLAVVLLATVMLMLDISVVNTALNDIATSLDTDLQGLQWVGDAYTLALSAAVLTMGSLADRFGRRRLFTVGLVSFTLASLACGLAGSIGELVAFRAAQGLGASILFATSLALLAQAFPKPAERGKALAAYGAAIGASFAIGPLVGGALTSGLGWRSVFLVNVPAGAAALLLVRRIEESRDPRSPRVDWAGQIALAGGLFLLVLALLRGNEDGWTSAAILAELGGAAVLLAGFAVIESVVKEPMLPLGLFRVRQFAGTQVAALGISASLFAIYFYVTLYLQQILGLSPLAAGAAYVPATLVNFGVAGATATFLPRLGIRRAISGGLALTAGGLAMLLVTGVDSSWALILPGMVVAMIGTGVINPALSAAGLSALPPEQSGLAAGAIDTFRAAGIAVGVALWGAFIPAHPSSPQAFVDGLHTAYVGCTIVALIGAVGAFLLFEGQARTVRSVAGRPVPEAA
jgi:EmrB/QacA subfamily drug resistance transporter